jgi:hypothetical protein
MSLFNSMHAQSLSRIIHAHAPTFVAIVAVATILATGCRTTQPKPPAPQETPKPGQTLRVIPESLTTPSATVRLVNAEARFVVIDFSLRQPPKPGDVLVVLRNNQKIAKVRITEPTRGSFVTADIVEGSIEVGDTIP